MIRVKQRTEPMDFDAKVRQPGKRWLIANPYKKGEKLPSFWLVCLPELRQKYKGICAYFGCWVLPATGTGSADHFVPKSGLGRRYAYEWSNYRFACARMNARKGVARTLLDPFQVVDGHFEIVFGVKLIVRAASHLPPSLSVKVDTAIDGLSLNSSECLDERTEHWENYCSGLTFWRFAKHAPFVAMEAARQGLLLPADQSITVHDIRVWLDS